ncbi:MAG: hypothetical protein SPJ81_06365 [Lachnoclostridium sp.]|nr:hypothetical protein [Lachnoclostridium sp.]
MGEEKLSPSEAFILEKFRKLPEEAQRQAIDYLEWIATRNYNSDDVIEIED